jgi:hypothetical protein
MKFIILCYPRTGSTLLIRALGDHPEIRQGMEIFNPILEGNAYYVDWRKQVLLDGCTAPFACSYPWHAVKLIDQSLRVDTCGFLHHVNGYDDIGLHGANDFDQLWNSPVFIHLRRTLQNGPLLPECLTCPYQLNGEWQSRASSDRCAESGAT